MGTAVFGASEALTVRMMGSARYGLVSSGSAGEAPALCEGIPLALDLANLSPDRVRAYPLNEAGDRLDPVFAEGTETGCRLSLGPQYKTLWYELVIE